MFLTAIYSTCLYIGNRILKRTYLLRKDYEIRVDEDTVDLNTSSAYEFRASTIGARRTADEALKEGTVRAVHLYRFHDGEWVEELTLLKLPSREDDEEQAQ